MTLQELNARIEEKSRAYVEKFKATQSDAFKSLDDYSQERHLDELPTLRAEIESLQRQAAPIQEAAAFAVKAEENIKTISQAVGVPVLPSSNTMTGVKGLTGSDFQVISRARDSQLTAFKGQTREEKAIKTYGFGQWFLASQFGNHSALKYCQNNGIEIKAGNEGVNSQGGALVPIQFDADLIDLREEYGVFRRNAKQSIMTSDTKVVPRRTGGLTVYYPGENASITDSTKGWDNVTLVARKAAVLAKYSSELNEDAIISIGNDLAQEITYAFAVAEDLNGFIGDGTSTYAGITGVTTKLKGLSGTIANIAGLVVGTGNLYSELTLADFNGVKSKLPQYARRGNVKWYMSQAFYSGVAEKLMLAAGGVTAAEIAAGREVPRFMGYPVEITQAMPSVEANSQVAALLGDLSLAALFGDRRMTTIAMSEHANFANDEWAIRGTERYDINVHDVGNADATAANRVAGPMVGLITAAS